MKTIVTKYFGPSRCRGSRIKAFDCDNNSVTIPYPYHLSGIECHVEAANSLITKMNWQCKISISDIIKISSKLYGVHFLV